MTTINSLTIGDKVSVIKCGQVVAVNYTVEGFRLNLVELKKGTIRATYYPNRQHLKIINSQLGKEIKLKNELSNCKLEKETK